MPKSRKKVNIRSTDLEDALVSDIKGHVETIVNAMAPMSNALIMEASGNKVKPEHEVVEEDGRKVARTYVPSSDKKASIEARKEEVFGSRPFAKIFNRMRSKGYMKMVLKNRGIH